MYSCMYIYIYIYIFIFIGSDRHLGRSGSEFPRAPPASSGSPGAGCVHSPTCEMPMGHWPGSRPLASWRPGPVWGWPNHWFARLPPPHLVLRPGSSKSNTLPPLPSRLTAQVFFLSRSGPTLPPVVCWVPCFSPTGRAPSRSRAPASLTISRAPRPLRAREAALLGLRASCHGLTGARKRRGLGGGGA